MPTLTRLRGHHLICLHFYSGKGYDDVFVSSLNRIIEDVKMRGLKIVEGADDVCYNCPHLTNDRCTFSENAEKDIEEMDKLALNLINQSIGNHVKWQDLKNTISSIINIWYERFCLNCFWLNKCAVKEFIQ